MGPYVSRKRVPDTVTKALNNFFDIEEEMNQTMIEKLFVFVYSKSQIMHGAIGSTVWGLRDRNQAKNNSEMDRIRYKSI